MPTVIATPGASNANSYVTVEEADTYHATRLHSETWTEADSTTKQIAVIHATRLLDALYEWVQFPTTSEQSLQWPRTGVVARNERDFVGNNVIPVELKNATAEFARQLIEEDRTLDSDVETQGVTSLKAGPVAITFKDNVSAKVVPDAVVSLLPWWWGDIRSERSYADLVRA